MTKDKHSKRAARAYAAEHGIAYVHARRLLAGAGGGQVGSTDPPAGGGHDYGDDRFDEFKPKPLSQLIEGAPQGECDRLIGETIHPTHTRGADGIAVDLTLPSGMTEPTVHQLDIPDACVDVQVDEEFEGGTLACNVTAAGMLTIEGIMSKADAINAAEAGEVQIFEAGFNRHYSSVTFDVEVEVTFEAILNPEYEGVEDFRFAGATVIGP